MVSGCQKRGDYNGNRQPENSWNGFSGCLCRQQNAVGKSI